MSNLSQNIKNGQLIAALVGAGAITAQQLVQVGGPGNELWPVNTIDYAATSSANTVAPAQVATYQAVNNYNRWPVQYDILGNAYVLTPNAAGQGVAVTKYSPAGAQIGTAVLDATASAMVSIHGLSLSNGNFAAVYAIASSGVIRFVIFDAALNIVATNTAVATGYATGNVSYIDASILNGSNGFAIVYQNSLHTQIVFQSYTNAGAAVTAATNIQALAGTGLAFLRFGLLSNGNLVCAIRYAAAAPAGTSFVVISMVGASVVANTIMDATATAGFLELSILNPGFFALSDMNGTNVQAAVYSNAGVKQGANYSGTSTLNSTTYNQSRMVNDGTNFYLCFIATAGGLQVVQLTQGGANTVANPTVFESAQFTSTSSIGAEVGNNLIFILSASITTGGQKYTVIGLPDAQLGITLPYVYLATTNLGTAAGTTGTYWPTVKYNGDFTVQCVYDQQVTAAMFFSQVKFAASAIVGVAQANSAAGTQGTVNVNVGSGAYPLTVMLQGTPGTAFNHGTAVPGGNAGTLYGNGAELSAPATQASGALSPTSLVTILGGSASFTYTAVAPTQLTVACGFTGGGTGATVNIGAATFICLSNTNAFTAPVIPLWLASGQSVTISTSSTGAAVISATKSN